MDDTFELTGLADIEVLTGKEKTDVNSISNPDNISPVKSQLDIYGSSNIELAPMSFTVIRVHTASRLMTVNTEKNTDNSVKYEVILSVSDEYDLFTALYDSDDKLIAASKNQPVGEYNVSVSGTYTLKAMLWRKASTEPVTEAVEEIIEFIK